ncbi:PREDICTED: glucan endo-1,3-beta-glucosidase-like [Camelina sativa]|uniref:glucan endo-1,3-beta-D-glucosidase n=1 Tax=Camelina sativa TaxID=90675 RepID=A0ABM1RPW2_CAMSA|nr:PREDICTED: glucan endo-1,3-beta-glucosidase-like [Camelina sativa]
MAKTTRCSTLPFLLIVAPVIFQLLAVTSAIGINYGTLGKLQPPQKVVDFIRTKTNFDSVKIYDANPNILRALAGSEINVTIMVPNGNIPAMVNVANARQWVAANVLPFHKQIKFKYLCVGNEIFASNDNNLISNLVPAMQSLNKALKASGLEYIKVTTPHAYNISLNHNAPSQSRFREDVKEFFTKILEFHRQAKSPFMFNPYPYFTMDRNNVNYAIFGPANEVTDTNTKHTYNNLFDAMMDAMYSAMKAIGYGDVDMAIGETGWPTACDAPRCSPQNAAQYNRNIIKRANVIGTPLMPNRHVDIFIFALFKEDGKPGPTCERNWGIFKPDFTPIYDVGVLKGGRSSPSPWSSPSPRSSNGKWCMAKQEATDEQLQANIDWVCSQGIDCKPISLNGVCFDNNNMKSRASYVMNAYYQSNKRTDDACNFSGTGMVTTSNPSTSTCNIPTEDTPSTSGKWCMAKEEATDEQLQANIDWVCSNGIDCNPISPGGICFDNNNMKSRSTFVMNAYYVSKGYTEDACDFKGSGIVTTTNPSTSTCTIPSGDAQSTSGKWCMAKEEATDEQLQANLDWVCSQGIDCKPISPGGICFDNKKMWTRSSYVMNAYYESKGYTEDACDFKGSGIVSTINPSTPTCTFSSGAPAT